MGKEVQNHTLSFLKLFNTHFRFNYVFHSFLFIIGLSVGLILALYAKNLSLDLKATVFSSIPPPPVQSPLSPPPLLLQPPPPTPTPLPPPSISQPNPPPQPNYNDTPLMHTMDDVELLRIASKVPRVLEVPYNSTPKIAFMFITKGPIPLTPLWEKFFEGHEGSYSIFIHPHPNYSVLPPEGSVFHERRIPSKAVEWGRSSMLDAERRILANALLDYSNQRFILLSETCIPLFNFTTIYNYLMGSDHQSFIGSFDDPGKPGRGRYNRKMAPTITLSQWRKGAQWFEVNREMAVEIISDDKYYPIFREHCTPPCYMDEHYIPTFVHIRFPDRSANRSITWVDWAVRGPHPRRYINREVSEELLNNIRFGRNCTYNGETTSICFLFARKFVGDTLQPLLQLAPVLFGPNTVAQNSV